MPLCGGKDRQDARVIECLQAETSSKISDICNRLDAVQLSSEDPEEYWAVFQNAVHSSAVDILGHTFCRQQDWFDENDEAIQSLLEEKHRLNNIALNIAIDTSSASKRAAYNNICKIVQSRHTGTQDSC